MSDTMSAKILQFVSRSEQVRLRGQRNYSRYMLVTKGFVAGDSRERAQWQKEYAEEARRDAEWNRRHGPVPGGPSVLQWRHDAQATQEEPRRTVHVQQVGQWSRSHADDRWPAASWSINAAARPDWELYRRLKAEGRLNLLFHFSEPAIVSLPRVETLTPPPNLLPFISRAEHLAWREQWRKGRWVKLSWTQKERDAILRQDELYRQADANWELNHGPIADGAKLLPFPKRLQLLPELVVDAGGIIEG
jgi:hypothetical protein